MNETNLISFLLLDAHSDERVVQLKNVDVGECFRTGGQSYKRTAERVGKNYNFRTHCFEPVVYNCIAVVAEDYEAYDYCDPNIWVIAK